MSQDIWINLPVKDVERSTAFFNEIGFQAVSVGNERSKLAIGQTTILLFPDAAFEQFTGSKTADTSNTAEVIFSIPLALKAEKK
jgi:predicted lactoylglutathione lyase